MKSTLIIHDDEGQRAAELPKERIVLGASPQASIPLRSRNAGLLPEHATMVWNAPRATWTLGRGAFPQAELSVNQRPLPPDATVGLNHRDVVELPGVALQFYREPEAPLFRGNPVSEFVLDRLPLVLGRGEKADGDDSARLVLDPEDSAISRIHAVIEKDGANFFLVDQSRVGTELNGKFFSRETLVYGDRFRIGDYLFEFTGRSILRVDQTSLGRVVAHNLAVEARTTGGRPLRILHNINLEIERGEFVGILGGGGQGKSALLNALCGARPATTGEVLISGIPLDGREPIDAAGVGFVPQGDGVHGELTVAEAITYSARLRLKLPPHQLRAVVDRVIERLSLREHRARRVSQLTSGQRKRVSVAIELLVKPSVLFLDEPASGLDPAAEADLMALLQSLRLTNLTVVCTARVPQKIYLFDRLVFVQGGRLVFIGTADEARRHFLARESDGSQGIDNAPVEKIYRLLADPTKTPEEWEREFLDSPPALRAAIAAARLTPPPEDPAAGLRRGRVGSLRTLWVLFARQWRLLRAEPLGLAFLLAQALVIGAMVGWVVENAALRMFLCVVATLWFGCGNAAQQIVGERSILRRERVCGLGLHVYLQSKLAFLSMLTGAQAAVLFVTIFLTAHAFQPNDFDRARFASGLEKRETSLSATASKPGTLATGVTSALANFFYLKDNILDSGSRQETFEDGRPMKDRDGKPLTVEGLSLSNVLITALGLKIVAVLASALVGVALGLTISALAGGTARAALWVPLLLILQILFGGAVVTVPEMSRPVSGFSQLVPGFAAQRVMDVSNVYGQATPLLTNRTKIPLFLTSDGSREKLEWEESGRPRSQERERVSPFNTSWQNLLVFPDRVGQHQLEGTRVADGNGGRVEYRDTTRSRYDVRYDKGTVFRYLWPAQIALLTLAVWVAVCYLITLLALRSRRAGN